MPAIVSTSDDQRAKRIDRDRRRIELAALAASLSVLRQAKRHAIAAYRLGHDPAAAAYDTLAGNGRVDGLGPLVSDAMTAGNLNARRRAVNEARQRSDVDDAILVGLLLIGDDEQTALAGEYERTAQAMVEPMAARVRVDVQTAVTYPLPKTVTVNKIQYVIRTPEQAIADAINRAGVASPTIAAPTSDYAVQRLYEAAVGIGYQQGRDAVFDHPEVKRTLVGLTYRTMRDNRVRPTHRLMEGVSRPADDPVWEAWTPPCGFGCRCVLLEVFEGEPFEPTVALPNVQPDRGWHGGEYFGADAGANLYSTF